MWGYCHRYVRVFLIFVIFKVNTYVRTYVCRITTSIKFVRFVSFSKSCHLRFFFPSTQFSLHLNFSLVSSLPFSTIIPRFCTIKMKIFGPRHDTNGEWRSKLQSADGEQVSEDAGDAWCTDVRDVAYNVTISHERNVAGKRDKKKQMLQKSESLTMRNIPLGSFRALDRALFRTLSRLISYTYLRHSAFNECH